MRLTRGEMAAYVQRHELPDDFIERGPVRTQRGLGFSGGRLPAV
jgi:hypothetical protein